MQEGWILPGFLSRIAGSRRLGRFGRAGARSSNFSPRLINSSSPRIDTHSLHAALKRLKRMLACPSVFSGSCWGEGGGRRGAYQSPHSIQALRGSSSDILFECSGAGGPRVWGMVSLLPLHFPPWSRRVLSRSKLIGTVCCMAFYGSRCVHHIVIGLTRHPPPVRAECGVARVETAMAVAASSHQPIPCFLLRSFIQLFYKMEMI